MRKIFSLLMVALFSATMFAAEPVTVKSTFTKATVPAENKVTDLEGVVTWDITTVVGAGDAPSITVGKNSSIECLKFGDKAALHFSKVTLSTDFYKDYNVTNVKLYVLNNGNKTATLTAKQGDVTIGTASATFGTTWTELEATGTKGNGGKLEVIYEVAQASYWSYIAVTYETAEGGDPTPEPTTRTIYLNGGGESLWNQANAVFFVHAWGGTGADVKMAQVEGNVYSAVIPSDNTQLVFVRMAPGSEAIDWATKWNQSADQNIPAENDLFTMTSWDNGTWSKYSAGGVTPEPPTPAGKDSIYFVNVPEWATPTVHLWGGTAAGTEWPGVALTEKEAEKINGYDVYKYVADKGAYANCIFSNNGENQTANLDWTSGKYYYENAWYAKEDIPAPLPDAEPLEGNIWKVVAETPVVAGSHYINEVLLKMDGVYGTTLKAITRTIAGEEFTYAIQVRTDGYPTEDNKVGKEKEGSTSMVITAKEDVDVTFYYNRQVVGEGGTDNDNKDLIVFDQADIANKVTGVFTIDQILESGKYLNATKKVALKKDHVYTVTASGTTLQLHGIKLEEHFPVMQIAGAWTEWAAKDMKLAENKLTATYEVELAKGDYEFKMVKDGAWLTKKNDGQAYGLHREWPGVAGVKDDATENIKLTADAAGKYTFTWTFANDSIGITFPDPEPAAKYYIVGNAEAFGEWSKFVPVYEDTYEIKDMPAGDYMFRLCMEDGVWTKDYGYAQLTVKPDGVSTNDDNNICFKFKEASDLKITYKPADEENPAVFTVEGNFYYKPVVTKEIKFVPNSWAEGGAKIAAWVWDKDGEMENYFTPFFAPIAENNDTLVANINVDADSIIFVRFNAAAEEPKWNGGEGYQWNQTPNDSIQWEKGIFTITGCEGYYCNGTWDAYIPETPAKFYITGDSALVVDAGLEADKAWSPSAIKSMETSYKLNLKAGVAYKLKITVDGDWKTGKGFDALTTVAKGLVRGEGVDNDNICFSLNTAGEVNVHYDGEYFFLNGDFYVAPEPEKKYYLKNNWNGGDEWTWKEMTKQDAYYQLENVVFGGNGVNLNTAASEEGQTWIAAADIPAMDMSTYEMTTLGAYDTVAFVFDPEAVNQYTGDHGLSAYILGKYVPAKFYITGDSALVVDAGLDKEKAWAPGAIMSSETSYKLNLKAGVAYMLKITVDGDWKTGKGFDALTTVAKGLVRGEGVDNDNICFSLNTAGEVNVHYDGEYFFLNGDFYVAPEPEKKYYLKNNWNGGDEWTWKEMTKVDAYYQLENVVFGGNGVNLNTAASEEGQTWIAAADIPALDMSTYEMTTLGAYDTVAFVFDPEAVNQYTGDHGLSAYILGKYVEPKLPVVALAGTMNEWSKEANVLVPAADELSASVKVTLGAFSYDFKMFVGGKWLSLYGEGETKYQFNREWKTASNINVVNGRDFELVADVPGEYTFTWTYADSTLTITFPDKPEVTLADGYYLIGQKGWTIYTLDASLKFEANGDVEGEYVLNNVVLDEGQELKVVKVAGNALTNDWYGSAGGNYIVTADVAGTKDVYFRPTWTTEWNGHIYIELNAPSGIDNTAVEGKAVKMIQNGQLLIIKGDKTYNVMGQMIR